MENKKNLTSSSLAEQQLFTPKRQSDDFNLLPCLLCTKEPVCKFTARATENAVIIQGQGLVSKPFSLKVNCEFFVHEQTNTIYRTSYHATTGM